VIVSILLFFGGLTKGRIGCDGNTAFARSRGRRANRHRTSIGPERGGYLTCKDGSTSLRDPQYATVLVIEPGDNRIALVTCDLRSFVSTCAGETRAPEM
jgi:hypothetical protein